MNGFLAILGDSVRLLRARRLFWITLSFSTLVAVLFLGIGFDSQGITLFGFSIVKSPLLAKGTETSEVLYFIILTKYLISIWLTFVTLILGLISCGPIFPEFMLEGSAGVTLSKPISRLALFFYKYLGGMLFVFAQTLLFVGIVFIAIRWRLGVWNFSVFWAVPIVLASFSYLFSIQTLVAVRTKSLMLSIFGALMMWFLSWIAAATETWSYNALRKDSLADFSSEVDQSSNVKSWRPVVYGMYLILPKVPHTSALLDREIKMTNGKGANLSDLFSKFDRTSSMTEALQDAEKQRFSAFFIVGTSLLFEAAILALAARSFTRRDF